MFKIKKMIRELIVSFRKWLKSCSLKKRCLLVAAIPIGGLMVYLISTSLSLSPTSLSLLKLKESLAKEKICHENCLLSREKEINTIVRALEVEDGDEKSAKLERKLEKYFLDSKESVEFKKELIKIEQQARGAENLPGYLKEYLNNQAGDGELQGLIIKLFLSEQEEVPPVAYYFSILNSERPEELKQAVITALGNIKDKKSYFNLSQLTLIKQLVLDLETEIKIRQGLVFLLGDYYPLFPLESEEILKAVYQNTNFDSISRAFSAEILNKSLGREKFSLPSISDTDWAEYYNN